MVAIIVSSIVLLYIFILYIIYSNKINKQDLKWKSQWETKTQKNISFFENKLQQLLRFSKIIIYILFLPCIWSIWILIRLLIITSLNYEIFLSSNAFKIGINTFISTLFIIGSIFLINKLIMKELAKVKELSKANS